VKQLSVIIFILNLLNARAQELDSLVRVALTLKSDTDRVNLFYNEGFRFRNKDPQFAFDCARAGNKSAIQSDSKRHMAKIYNLFGVLYYKKGEYKSSLAYHQKALKLREECKDILGIAHSETNLGNVYSDLKLFLRAENSYLKAMDCYGRLNDNDKIVSCLLNIGTIKHNLKQYDAAIQNYTIALQKLRINDYETKAIFLTNVAQAYIGNKMIEKGIAYNEDAIKLRTLSENVVETGDNYLNLGGAYVVQKEFDKAKYYIDTAMFVANKYDYAELKYKVRKIYAIYYSEIKDFEKAFYWLRKYNDLGDTILIQQNFVKELFDFNEEENMGSVMDSRFKFPYFYLNILIITSILIIVLAFKYKR